MRWLNNSLITLFMLTRIPSVNLYRHIRLHKKIFVIRVYDKKLVCLRTT